jgi:DNA-cytosine methyltransferase
MKKPINVLSLFNGMNCIGLALKELGVEAQIYASEIDKYANKVSDTLFPDTVNLGCVTKINANKLPKIDLICGGSPCQGFSFAGKGLNFEDPRSKLFFEFVRILKECQVINPNVIFLLENVRMKKQHEDFISKTLGIEPIMINSSLVSAQNRERLYWTNICSKDGFFFKECGIKQPQDKRIFLKDVLENYVDKKYFLSEKAINYIKDPVRMSKKFTALNGDKSLCLTAQGIRNNTGTFICHNLMPRSSKTCKGGTGHLSRNDGKTYCLNTTQVNAVEIKCGAMRGRNPQNPKSRVAGLPTEQQLELRSDDKTNCLTSVQKDNLVVQLNRSKESNKCQPFQQNRVYDPNYKSPCLDTDSGHKNVLTDYGIRRLTPRECAMLQTIPLWAIEKMLNCGVSDTQIYKMFGNGWTVDVITYILSHEKSLF